VDDGRAGRTRRIQDATLLSILAVVLVGWLALLAYLLLSLLT